MSLLKLPWPSTWNSCFWKVPWRKILPAPTRKQCQHPWLPFSVTGHGFNNMLCLESWGEYRELESTNCFLLDTHCTWRLYQAQPYFNTLDLTLCLPREKGVSDAGKLEPKPPRPGCPDGNGRGPHRGRRVGRAGQSPPLGSCPPHAETVPWREMFSHRLTGPAVSLPGWDAQWPWLITGRCVRSSEKFH